MQEMPRSMLDALRQPMEDGVVLIARAQTAVSFPARFALVGAMNPCPCGFAGDASRPCVCAAADIVRHRARISGPLADRIDMTVHVPAVAIEALSRSAAGEPSSLVRDRVVRARHIQHERYRASGVSCNAHVQGRWLDVNSPLAADARRTLISASERLGLSARGFHRVLRLARTVADLDTEEVTLKRHIAEALFFRLSPQTRLAGTVG
jgi:magnesium chelatase family protein